jgi:predicted secreted protein
MGAKTPSAEQRLERMRRSFNKDYSVLAEDYEFFTHGAFISDASISPSKARRKSARRSARRSPKRS